MADKTFRVLDPSQRHETPVTSDKSEPVDWTRCILCQETTNEVLQCPADSRRADVDIDTVYETVASNLLRFKELGNLPQTINLSRLDNGTGVATTIQSNCAKWHKKCKDNYNTTKLKRAEKKKLEHKSETSSHSPKRKVTRYSSGGATRISQDTCFFCGEHSDNLHKASMDKLDTNVRRCAEIVQDNLLIGILSAGDMMSQDAMYHGKCLKELYKKAELVNHSNNNDSSNKQLHGIALAELISYIEDSRADSIDSDVAPVFKLADLTHMYTSRLDTFGADISVRAHSTRLKERILTNIPDLHGHKQGRDVLLAFEDDIGLALKKALECDFDEEGIVLAKAAAIVRRDILKHEKTVFNGTFSHECQQQAIPQSLSTLVSMIMTGPNIVQQSSNATDTQAMLTVSQLIRHNVIIRRREGSVSHYHSQDREPPLPIYLGLLIHGRTRNRAIVDKLYDLGISISYDRVLSISTDLANEVCARYEAEHVVCPTHLRHGLFTTSAADNIDHNPTSTTAQGSFHGTGISIFQHPSKNVPGENRDTAVFVQSGHKQKTISPLPDDYTSVFPASLHTRDPPLPEVTVIPHAASETISTALQDENKWLSHVKDVVDADGPLLEMDASWAAYHASNIEHDIEAPTDISALLPLFTDKANSPAMICHAMKVVKKNVEFLNPGQTPVIALDQPLFALAKQIQWNWPNTYGEDKLVVMFGGLHIEMAAFNTIGDWLDESGWSNALVMADISSPGTADSFLKASHLTRTRHVHQITVSSLYILMAKAYEQYTHSLPSDQIPEEVDIWRKRRIEESPQFHYWSTTMEFELTILSFVRSLREANFKLYMESIDQLLPWFFALDHTNYSRWLPVHLRDMMNLENMHPDIAAQFESGKFVIKKTHRRFSSIAIDQCHEQNNCIVKDEEGAIGLTENTSQLLRWMVAGPEMARVIGEFEHSAESIKRKMSQGPDVKHHEQTRSVQATFVKQVRSLCHAIDEMGNPFEEHTGDLLVLDKRDIMGENVVSTVHNIQKLGKEKYDTFVKERIEERTVTLLTPLKRNKLPLFSCPQPMTKSVDKQQITSLKKTCTLFSQLYVSCQVRDGNIAEFFRHENQSYPPSLSKFGDLRSGTKADLVGCLKDTYPAPTEDSPEVDAILLDGAAIINMLKPGHAKTFDEYSRLVFLPYIRSQLEKAKRVDIVWDEYIKDSLKRMTRQKRGKGTRRRVQSHTKIPGNWESFLRVDENKVELFAFLAQQSVTLQGEQNVISTFGKEVLQNYPREDNSRLSPCTHEEADTRLLLHAKDAAADGYRRVMLRTVDTDVVVLSIALFAQTNLTELWISFGTGKNRRQIPIHTIARTLGPEKASSLLMFHTFTGCDQTSFFVNKGKKTAWETLKIFPDVVEAFATLVMEPPSEQTLKEHIPTIERFVVLMYDRTSCCDNVDDARKELFTQKGRSIENIPPTSAAMYQHAKRAAYQAGHCWGQALLRAPALPNPADWGWKRGRSQLWEPLWITLTEACKSCEELLKCSCKVDRGCLGRCKCVKAGMACTSYCKCHGDCERQ